MKGAMGGSVCGFSSAMFLNWTIFQDLLASADEIQKSAETSLGGKFETVVALDDFAYKSHFKVSCSAFHL